MLPNGPLNFYKKALAQTLNCLLVQALSTKMTLSEKTLFERTL